MSKARDAEDFVLCKTIKKERNKLIAELLEEVQRFKSSYGHFEVQLREKLENAESALQTAADNEEFDEAEKLKKKRDELKQQLTCSTSVGTSVAKSSMPMVQV